MNSLNEKLYWFTSSSGRIEFQMTQSQVDLAHHQGQCNLDVAEVVKELRPTLDKLDRAALATELKEYGAWNADELADHESNLHRIVWLAAADIQESDEYKGTLCECGRSPDECITADGSDTHNDR
jgi:hypothetical protein